MIAVVEVLAPVERALTFGDDCDDSRTTDWGKRIYGGTSKTCTIVVDVTSSAPLGSFSFRLNMYARARERI